SRLVAANGVNGALIWGEVPDVRPFLAAADVVLAPLSIARGVQNKVLEAMAMARPTVVTGAVATGLPGKGGEHFAVADSDAGLTQGALCLLAKTAEAERMGRAARRLVVETMSWSARLAPLPDLLGLERRSRRHRNAA